MADKDEVQELARKLDEVRELARKLDEVQELARKLDEVIELARKLYEVQELARKLDGWAENELKKYPKQQTLLRWLLSRGLYIEKWIDGHVEGGATHVFEPDIEQAVKDALGPLIRINLPGPIEGWPRFSPDWPRFSPTWPRDGYWALGMGLPPKLGKMPPKTPDKTPPEAPETPPV